MSAAATSPIPPARAGPAIRATTGLGHSHSSARTSASIATGGCPARRACSVSFRSAPEQNTGPVWSSTTTRTAGSAIASASPARSWVISGVDSALRLCGLSRVRVATPCAVVARTKGRSSVMPRDYWGSSARGRAGGRRTAAGGAPPARRRGSVPGRLPDGAPAPPDGALPPAALAEMSRRRFGVYVHVPFCASRCGYCDFNTYTPGELGGATSAEAYVTAALAELRLAGRVLADTPPATVDTVFFGGGTPTLLPAAELARILAAIDDQWGLAPDAEVTTEANPESVDEAGLAALRAAGF